MTALMSTGVLRRFHRRLQVVPVVKVAAATAAAAAVAAAILVLTVGLGGAGCPPCVVARDALDCGGNGDGGAAGGGARLGDPTTDRSGVAGLVRAPARFEGEERGGLTATAAVTDGAAATGDEEAGAATPAATAAATSAAPAWRRDLLGKWRTSPETCAQWVDAQRTVQSYVDVYILGVQKGATSEMARRLFDLGVSPDGMTKEWDLMDVLTRAAAGLPPVGDVAAYPGLASVVAAAAAPDAALGALRAAHYALGFPKALVDASEGGGGVAGVPARVSIPLVDGSPRETRRLVADASVDYQLSTTAAGLIHRLTPHARFIMTFREPVGRALSQYNMMIRLFNKGLRARGKPEMAATPDHFHYVVTREMALLRFCGYDPASGTLADPAANVSALTDCMTAAGSSGPGKPPPGLVLPSHPRTLPVFDTPHYVLRGLYALHVDTWTSFFPASRFLYLRFTDLTSGNRRAMEDIAAFSCVRPYPNNLLSRYAAEGAASGGASHGQQLAAGMATATGELGWTYAGNDSYVGQVEERTRAALEAFYAGATARLETMLGQRMWD